MTCPFCLNRTHISCTKVPLQLHLLAPFPQSRQMKTSSELPTLQDFNWQNHTLFYPCYFCLEVREVDLILASFKSYHLVKLKNSSHVHSFWLGQAALKMYAPTKRRHHSPSPIGTNSRAKSSHSPLIVESENQNLPEGPFVEPNSLEVDFIVDDFEKRTNKKGSTPANRHPCADEKQPRSKGIISRMLLVKWKGLSYSDVSWQCYDFIAEYWPKTIAHFKALKEFKLPPANSKSFQEFKKSPSFIHNPPPSFKKLAQDNLELFDFQVKGLNFLCKAWHQSRSVILGDQMGLGKTIQAIAFLRYLMLGRGVSGPFLIIAPLSTLQNFRNELTRWLPFAYPVPFVGNRTSRGLAKHFEFPTPGQAPSFDILLTSYEVLRLEANALRCFQWKVLIVDEAHRLKNETSKLFGALSHFKADFRLLLTGTPLQNTLEELCSLLRFLDPTEFARLAAQNSHFASLEELIAKEGSLDKSEQKQQSKELETMRKILEKRMLRRRKEEVLALPPLTQEVVWLPLTVIQQRWSKLIMFRNFQMTSLFEKGRHLRKISSLYVKLRHICNHPFLLSQSEEAPEQEENKDQLQTLINASSKLEWLNQKLPKIREQGQKVLIFTQTRLMLDLLERFLELRGFTFLRLDGQTPSAQRQVLVDKFNLSPDSFAFLLSTRAGGLGLNISSASIVIIYESDFNPHNDLQALSRAHRLGQTSGVTVFRLLCKDSVEQGIFKMARRKLFLQELLTPSLSQSEQLNPESSAKSAFKAVTHEAAALFKFPSSEKQKEINQQAGLQNLNKSEEGSESKKRNEDREEEIIEDLEEEKNQDSDIDKGQTEEWVQNFRRQFQEYKEGEAAEMGKGKRERKSRISKFVSYEVLQLSDEDIQASLLQQLNSEPVSEAYHLSVSSGSPKRAHSEKLKLKQLENVPEKNYFEIERLTAGQAEQERKHIKEKAYKKEQLKAALERQEKELRAKELASIQAAIQHASRSNTSPPQIIRPTPVYGSICSPPSVHLVPGQAINEIGRLYHSEQSSFHITNSPQSGSNSRL